MSRKPHPMHRQTGDQGQRFLVRTFGYPKVDQENDIGFYKELKSAQLMRSGIHQAPTVKSSWIVDREEDTIIDLTGKNDAEPESGEPSTPPTD